MPPSEHSKALRSASITAEAKQISTFTPAEEVLSDPRWVHFILNDPDGHIRSALTAFVPDDRHVLMAVFLKPDLSFNEELAAAARIEAITGSAHYANAATITTGVPEIEKDVSDYIRTGLRDLVALAAFVMCLILVLAFRVRWRLLPLGALGCRHDLGLRSGGVPGHPPHVRHLDRRARAHGSGHGLHDPDAHAHRGRSVCLNRSSHPIQSAARAGDRPAHRDIRCRVRLRRAVVGTGARRAPVPGRSW